MKHFIYKVVSSSGKYYIGRHSTDDINDGYVGSGKWVRSLKHKSELVREILEYSPDLTSLVELERKYIAEHINNSDNMNFNNEPVGFASGDYHYMKDPANVKRITSKRIANGNHKHTEKTKEHLSKVRTGYKTGKPAWNTGLTKETNATLRTMASKISATVSTQMDNLTSAERKEKFGNTGSANGFYNKHHSTKTKQYLSECRKREKWTCEHCGKQGGGNANYSRWHGVNCRKKAGLEDIAV